MYRILFLTFVAALLLSWQLQADVVVEQFNHPVQLDSTGFDDGSDIFFRITTTGGYGTAGDLRVASFSEGTSESAGIQDSGSNRFATFSTQAASGFGANQNLLLGIADFPGFGGTSPGGSFGNFFSTPQDLTNASGSVEIRQTTSNPTGGVIQFLAIDQNDNEVTTGTFGLTSTFATYNFSSSDFVFGDPGFDSENVIGIGVEFFAQANGAGEISAFQFDVDNLQLSTVPEPRSAILLGTAVMLGVTLRRKRSCSEGA